MAGRPPKEGLDYSEWDLWVLDNDKKIDALLEAQGALAFVVYFYLTQHAYAEHGYYLDWDYDSCPTTARRLGRGVSAEYVRCCVEKCLQVGLFHKGLFESHGILTSEGIQKRYWKVAKNRTSRGEARPYWLLEMSLQKEENSEGLVPCTQNGNYEPPKFDYEPPKCTESRGEQSFSSLSLKAHGKHKNVMLTDEQYTDIKERIPDADTYIDRFSEKLHTKGYTFADHHATILAWWESDRKRGAARERVAAASTRRRSGKPKAQVASSFDLDEFMKRALARSYPSTKDEKENANGK